MTGQNSDSLTPPLETYEGVKYVSDYYAVDAVRAFLPDLGRRPLTLGEFYQLARLLDISVLDTRGKPAGFCVSFAGSTHIFLDEHLPEPMKTFVAYHEMAHTILHIAEFAKLMTDAEWARADRWMEREANLIADLALLTEAS